MKRILFSFALALMTGAGILSAQEGYDRNTFTSSTGYTLQYRSLDPLQAKPGRKYPLVLFLHGAGERGTDNELQLLHGSGMFLNPGNRDRFPAYVVFPQCPPDGFWAYDPSVLKGNDFGRYLPADTAVLVDASRAAYRKLTSLGAKVEYTEYPGAGHGVWNMAFSEPDFFSWLFRQHR